MEGLWIGTGLGGREVIKRSWLEAQALRHSRQRGAAGCRYAIAMCSCNSKVAFVFEYCHRGAIDKCTNIEWMIYYIGGFRSEVVWSMVKNTIFKEQRPLGFSGFLKVLSEFSLLSAEGSLFPRPLLFKSSWELVPKLSEPELCLNFCRFLTSFELIIDLLSIFLKASDSNSTTRYLDNNEKG